MMLHATSLKLPFSPGDGPGCTLDLVSEDPFTFIDSEVVLTTKPPTLIEEG